MAFHVSKTAKLIIVVCVGLAVVVTSLVAAFNIHARVTGAAVARVPQCPGAASGQLCSGHGDCEKKTGVCSCDDGWAPPDCSKRLSTCPFVADADGVPQQCSGVGVCHDGACVCPEGREGANCGVAVTVCPGNSLECGGHGECKANETGGRHCVCDAGYSGDACTVGTACEVAPGEGGSLCNEAANDVATGVHNYCQAATATSAEHCVCDEANGYVGPACTLDGNECAEDATGQPCGGLDHGRCVTTKAGNHVCECKFGRGGLDCSLDPPVNPATGHICSAFKPDVASDGYRGVFVNAAVGARRIGIHSTASPLTTAAAGITQEYDAESKTMVMACTCAAQYGDTSTSVTLTTKDASEVPVTRTTQPRSFCGGCAEAFFPAAPDYGLSSCVRDVAFAEGACVAGCPEHTRLTVASPKMVQAAAGCWPASSQAALALSSSASPPTFSERATSGISVCHNNGTCDANQACVVKHALTGVQGYTVDWSPNLLHPVYDAEGNSPYSPVIPAKYGSGADGSGGSYATWPAFPSATQQGLAAAIAAGYAGKGSPMMSAKRRCKGAGVLVCYGHGVTGSPCNIMGECTCAHAEPSPVTDARELYNSQHPHSPQWSPRAGSTGAEGCATCPYGYETRSGRTAVSTVGGESTKYDVGLCRRCLVTHPLPPFDCMPMAEVLSGVLGSLSPTTYDRMRAPQGIPYATMLSYAQNGTLDAANAAGDSLLCGGFPAARVVEEGGTVDSQATTLQPCLCGTVETLSHSGTVETLSHSGTTRVDLTADRYMGLTILSEPGAGEQDNFLAAAGFHYGGTSNLNCTLAKADCCVADSTVVGYMDAKAPCGGLGRHTLSPGGGTVTGERKDRATYLGCTGGMDDSGAVVECSDSYLNFTKRDRISQHMFSVWRGTSGLDALGGGNTGFYCQCGLQTPNDNYISPALTPTDAQYMSPTLWAAEIRLAQTSPGGTNSATSVQGPKDAWAVFLTSSAPGDAARACDRVMQPTTAQASVTSVGAAVDAPTFRRRLGRVLLSPGAADNAMANFFFTRGYSGYNSVTDPGAVDFDIGFIRPAMDVQDVTPGQLNLCWMDALVAADVAPGQAAVDQFNGPGMCGGAAAALSSPAYSFANRVAAPLRSFASPVAWNPLTLQQPESPPAAPFPKLCARTCDDVRSGVCNADDGCGGTCGNYCNMLNQCNAPRSVMAQLDPWDSDRYTQFKDMLAAGKLAAVGFDPLAKDYYGGVTSSQQRPFEGSESPGISNELPWGYPTTPDGTRFRAWLHVTGVWGSPQAVSPISPSSLGVMGIPEAMVSSPDTSSPAVSAMLAQLNQSKSACYGHRCLVAPVYYWCATDWCQVWEGGRRAYRQIYGCKQYGGYQVIPDILWSPSYPFSFNDVTS